MRQRLFYGVGVTPPDIMGSAVAWWDYLRKVTKDGLDAVSVFGDLTVNGNDLLQALGAKQPLWTENGILFNSLLSNVLKSLPFPFEQPEFIYLVVKQVTWGNTRRFFDGDLGSTGFIDQSTVTPNIRAFGGAAFSGESSDLLLNQYGIIRVLFNGANSKLQVNENAPIIGNFGVSDMDGFTLGGRADGGQHTNIEVKGGVCFEAIPSASDEQAVYDYFKDYYNLPI